MTKPLVAILHPEGNVNNNPGLSGIVELLVADGWRVEIHSPLDGVISQKDPCPGASMVLADPSAAAPGCILPHPGGMLPPALRRRFEEASLIVGVDRGIVEASAIARSVGRPFGLVSYEIFFADEAGAEFKTPEIEACRGLSFAIVQDEARARELARENRIDRGSMFLVPVAGVGSFPPPDPRPRLFHERFGLPAGARVALFMGSVARWSACGELVESVRNWPADWHLVIHNRYAADHASRVDDETRRLLRSVEGRPRIHVSATPFDLPSQMRDFIFSADLGVAFYRPTYENMYVGKNLLHIGMASGKIAAYLQHGVPVAVNRIGEMSDWVVRKGIGRVVDDPRAFVPDDGVLDAAPRCIGFFEERLDPGRTLAPWLRHVRRFRDAAAQPAPDIPARRKGGAAAGRLPRITIVTPSFNQAPYLEECIDSILSQGYPNLEYIVMDGGSTDGSVEIIRKYERHLAYWQSRPDGGHYAALNEGFRRSSGEVMGWLNSDDRFHPGGLKVLADVFSSRPDVAFLTGRREGFDADGNVRSYGFENQRWSRALLLDPSTVRRHLFVMQEATYWRRWLWEKAGGALDVAWKQAGDYELWLRFLRHARLHTVDARIGGFRLHGADQRSAAFVEDYQAECVRAIERERAIPSAEPALDASAPELIAYPLREDPPDEIPADGLRDFLCAKRRHFDLFRGLDVDLFGREVDPDDCDLKAYQDLLVYAYIRKHVPKGSRILDVGGGDSRILRRLRDEYDCWNLDKLEGVGNGPKSVEAAGYRLVSDYVGNFNPELPEESFDLVFSISALEHVPEGIEANRELYRNICIDIDRLLKPGGASLHCFDITLSDGRCWGHELMGFMAGVFTPDAPPLRLPEMARDPERYVISRKYFDANWKSPVVPWEYDDGMPSSCNLFWRKAPGAAAHDPRSTWAHYKRFRVARDERYPRISVVTPSFNQSRFLADTIESVLGQGYPNLEYIVVDGGSTDGSVDVIRRYGEFLAHWQSGPDGGQYRGIGLGLSRATGEIMTWINSDDVFHPGAFAFAALAFMERPELRWMMGCPNGIDAEGRQAWIHDTLPSWSREMYLSKRYRDPYIQQEGTFWRKSLWEEAGGYLRADMQYAGDLELWTRFFRHAQLHAADALLAAYRQHPGQKMANFLEMYHREAEAVLDFEIERFRREKEPKLLPAPPPVAFESPGDGEEEGGARS